MCDRFPRKFDVQTSYKPSNYVLCLIFVVNTKFPWEAYHDHTIVPSTEELYCLNTLGLVCPNYRLQYVLLSSFHSSHKVDYVGDHSGGDRIPF